MRNTITICVLLLLTSCSTQPQPIQFGSDGCDYCRMMIANEIFGGEIVTKKGKLYKFDSGECMINFLRNNKVRENEIASQWVINAAQPKDLIEATKAIYVYTEKFPSPMGGYISAFESKEEMQKFIEQYGGDVLSWNEVKEKAIKI